MPERILVRATNWVGDLVMSTPALAGIRKNYRGAQISVLVRPPLDELLKGNPSVDEVILFDKKGLHAGPAGMARLIAELRKKKFSRAILLQNAFEAALIAFLAKIPERMGYATDSRGILLTKSVKVASETRKKHQVFYYLDLLSALGLVAGETSPRLYLGKEDVDYARRLLREHGIKQGTPIVGINPGAQYGIAKKWYPERFAYVADHLTREFGAKVIIFGGAGDATAARTVQAAMKEDALNLAGKTSLRGLMALVKRCSVFITNDTGPMHVAAAEGVPTLAIFGSTDPAATGPFGKCGLVIREPVNCSPCLERKCPDKHYICMERVSAERVLKAARAMLSLPG